MAVNITETLNLHGIDTGICSLRSGGPLEERLDSKTNLFLLGKKSAFDIFAFFKLRRWIIQNDFDLIHAHSSTIIWAVILSISGVKAKIVWHDHFGGLNLNQGIVRRFVLNCLNQIHGVISVNERLYNWIKLNSTTTRLIQLDNFPILAKMSGKTVKADIVLLANFRRQKDHFTFLQSLVLLREEGLCPTFSLVGHTVDKDYRGEVDDFIINNGKEIQLKYLEQSY